MQPKRKFCEPETTAVSLNQILSEVCRDDQGDVELGTLAGLPELQCELPSFNSKDLVYGEW